MAEISLKGMGVALITPFKEDESVDYEAQADWLIIRYKTEQTTWLFWELRPRLRR